MVRYNIEGDPTETGVYACRVPMPDFDFFKEDKFLMWIDDEWTYPGSDQPYRGVVEGWIGPLQRKMN